MTWRRACGVEDLKLNEALRIDIAAHAPVAIYKLDQGIYCTDDTCTHEDAPLSAGEIEGDCIVCPFHRGAFNIRTGAAVRAPCSVDLKTYPVAVVGADVLISLD